MAVPGPTGAEASKIIDAYIADLPADQARALTELRAELLEAVPDGIEAISYSMPALKVGKRVLVYYAAFTTHLSLFPASGSVMDKLGADLQTYFTGKGTLQFTPDKPLPPELVRQIVAIRREELGLA